MVLEEINKRLRHHNSGCVCLSSRSTSTKQLHVNSTCLSSRSTSTTKLHVNSVHLSSRSTSTTKLHVNSVSLSSRSTSTTKLHVNSVCLSSRSTCTTQLHVNSACLSDRSTWILTVRRLWETSERLPDGPTLREEAERFSVHPSAVQGFVWTILPILVAGWFFFFSIGKQIGKACNKN